jgi:lysyl-tRNA synthetase class 2
MKERSCFSRPFDGKTHHGKASFAELKDAEGRIQVYVSRDDISTDEEKQCTMWFQNCGYWRFYGVRGTVFKTQVGEISVRNGLTVLAKLETASVVKRMQMEKL